MRKTLATGLSAGVLFAAAAAVLPATAATAATGEATLSVLHAVPDVTVDVYLDGERAIDDFTPGTLAGPMMVPAGAHQLAITASDATDASKPIIGPADVSFDAGGNYTAVAHDATDGSPTATVFTNDTSAVAAGQGRLVVRHVAAAPAVDVLAGGQAVVSNLSNPDEQALELPAGTVSASVAATGTTDPVIGPADVAVTAGSSTIVHAWGSLDDDDLALATQTIADLGGTPNGVPAGNAGLVATNDQAPCPWSAQRRPLWPPLPRSGPWCSAAGTQRPAAERATPRAVRHGDARRRRGGRRPDRVLVGRDHPRRAAVRPADHHPHTGPVGVLDRGAAAGRHDPPGPERPRPDHHHRRPRRHQRAGPSRGGRRGRRDGAPARPGDRGLVPVRCRPVVHRGHRRHRGPRRRGRLRHRPVLTPRRRPLRHPDRPDRRGRCRDRVADRLRQHAREAGTPLGRSVP